MHTSIDYFKSLLMKQLNTTPELLYEEDQLGLHLLTDGGEYKEFSLFMSALTDCVKNPNRRVALISDYDTDGVCSFIIGMIALHCLGVSSDQIYILKPNSYTGYGITIDDILEIRDVFIDSDPSDVYILTADVGVMCDEAISFATQQLGFQCIVTDHHVRSEGRVPARAVIDPNQAECPSTFKSSSGAMVLFKTFQAFFDHVHLDEVLLDVFHHTLLFGAISTVGDMMPIVLENRQILIHVLSWLNTPYYFLDKVRYWRAMGVSDDILRFFTTWDLLFHTLHKDNKELDESFFGFSVSPLLNAPRRVVGSAKASYDPFLSYDLLEKEEGIKELISLNELRKDRMKQLKHTLITSHTPVKFAFINAHSGYAGLVAGFMQEINYYVSICFSLPHDTDVQYLGYLDKDMIKYLEMTNPIISASCRSSDNVHLLDSLKAFDEAYPDTFLSFGGHKAAAGIRMRYLDSLTFFKHFANGQFLVTQETDTLKEPIIFTASSIRDGVLDQYMVAYQDVLRLGPFGQGFNIDPVVFQANVFELSHKTYLMGEEKTHVKWSFDTFDIIFWNGAYSLEFDEYKQLLTPLDSFIVMPSINQYNGVSRVNFIVKHMIRR